MTLLDDRLAPLLRTRSSRALSYLPATAFALDLGLIVVAMALAVVGRRILPFFDSVDVGSSVVVAAPLIAVAWLMLIVGFGGYQSDVFGEGAAEFKQVMTGSLYAAAALGVGCYLCKYDLSRGFFMLAFIIGIPLLLVGRFVLRRILHAARIHGSLLQRVLLVGNSRHVDEVAGVLRRERWLGYTLTGALTPYDDAGDETPGGVPVLGHADEVTHLVEQTEGADVVVFAGGGGHLSAGDLRRIQWDLERRDVQLVVAPSLTDISSERVTVRPVGGLPLMHLQAPRWENAGRWAKRAFDVVGSSALILAASPVLILAALRVKLHDGGDVFFRQTRVGRFGQEFSCFKFRTMVMNADQMIARMQEEQGATALLFKQKDDPRITRPGRWLRRFSIDELPQLFNVFLGDMSLVGPRPQVPREVALYDDALRRRLNVRPGMTGLWQVSGRNDLSLEDSIRLDLYYIDNWSMLQDLAILMRTFGAVLSSKGAY